MTGRVRRGIAALRRHRVLWIGACVVVGAGLGLAAWSLLSDEDEQGGATATADPPALPADPPPPEPRPRATRRKKKRKPSRARRDNRPDAAPKVAATPPRLEVPAIGVRAHTITLGTTSDNKLEVPRNWSEVGWWRGGSRPGKPGVAVLVGHVDSKTGPAVFYRLRELRRGDSIRFVPRRGSPVRFVVDRLERHSKKRFPTKSVYEETSKPVLRLITCGGSFDWSSGHYRQNVIVYAHKA